MTERRSVVRLMANIADFKAQMREAEKSTKKVGDQAKESAQQATTALGRMAQSAQKNRDAWDRAGTSLAAFGAVTVAGLGLAVKAAIDWESAWTGVTKTVNGSEKQLAAVEEGLRGLARTLPSSHEEIAAVAEAAGQLGVKTENIVGFTKTMIDLGQTTNLSADQAATSLAQLMNVMGTAPQDVGRLGAALVALGNAGASTEAEIVNMASYITGSAKLIGASESDVLALSNAMVSMGINAERGGGVMTRVLQDVYAAVQEGGDRLQGFADVAGMSAKDFAAAFQKDPMRAVDAFIQGLNDVEASGGNVVSTLNDLGYKGTQDTSVLLQMKGAGDLLTDSLDLGNKAWEQNTALVQEAAKRYDTTASKLAIARNNINDAAIEIGEVFTPALADMAEGVAGVAKWFADLPDPIKATVGALAGAAGVGALAGGAFLLLFPRVIETYKAFQTLKTVSPGVATGLGAVGKAAGFAGIVLASASALDSFVHSLAPAPPSMEATTKALLNMGNSFRDVDAQFSGMSSFLIGDIDGLDGAIQRLTKPSNFEKLSDWVAKVITLGNREGNDTTEALTDQFNQMGEALAFLVESGNAELAAKQFDILAAKWKAGGGDLDDLRALLPAYQEALDGVDNEQKAAAGSAQLQAQSAAQLAQNLEATYGSLEGYAAALGLSEDATADLIKQSQELGQSLADFIDPLGTYTGLLQEKAQAEADAANKTAEKTGASAKSWEDFVGDVKVSFAEYMTQLQEQVKAQEDWQLNMLLLAGRVSDGTLAELSRMGPEGAPLVADLVKRSDAELDKFDDLTARRSKEATDAWGAQLTMATPVLTAIAAKAGKGAADAAARELAAGTKTIAQIAQQYGVALAGGVNPLLASLGKPQIDAWGTYRPQGFIGPVQTRFIGPVQKADGGVLDFYADGGMEDHTAQIAPAGAWRVWAEPETEGEAYIPLAASKRTRSVDIWREVGKRLGVQFEEFAGGGFSSVDDVPRPPSTAPYRMPISTAADAAMAKAYGDTVDWLKTHLAPALGPGIGWQAMMGALHTRFPGLPLISGFRPGSITATGNLSYHAMGRAVDIPPDMAIFDWLAQNYPNARELIFSPAGGRQIWNGAPHFYNEPTRGDHWDHVHWAMAKGGILNPHVRDAGGPLLPGYTFNGTSRPEWVTPMVDAARAGGWNGAPLERRTVIYDQRQVHAQVDARKLSRQMARDQHDMEFLHG